MKIIAYYLPQFHPIKENNEWWGEGFTEWTNVGKAKALYPGHYQPRVPKDLGYYDLRLNQVRNQQVALAREAGVDAFCYWHYWFGNGKRLLELPFNEVLKSGDPDFPFCLGWANESWKAKVWNLSSAKSEKVLIEQKYPGPDDVKKHFYELLEAFKDKRYLRIRNKPVFVIYKPFLMPEPHIFIATWNELSKVENISDGIHFIAYTENSSDLKKLLEMGFSAVNIVRNAEQKYNKNLQKKIIIPALKYKLFNMPLVINYDLVSKYFVQDIDKHASVYPTIIPNWDHTPRSGRKGTVYHNSTPGAFSKHVQKVLEIVARKNECDQIIFLKSWNEWAEGNYMEPDLKFGKEYIETLGALRKLYI